MSLCKRQVELLAPKSAKASLKPSAKAKAIHASANGLPIKKYKSFVDWLERFSNGPGPLGLTADAALSSIGALTMLLSGAMNRRHFWSHGRWEQAAEGPEPDRSGLSSMNRDSAGAVRLERQRGGLAPAWVSAAISRKRVTD